MFFRLFGGTWVEEPSLSDDDVAFVLQMSDCTFGNYEGIGIMMSNALYA